MALTLGGLGVRRLGRGGGAGLLRATLVLSTILLTATPDAMRGRLSGIELAQVASAPMLGNVEAGVVASLTTVRFSIASGGLMCVAGTLLIALTMPALRHYRARAAPA